METLAWIIAIIATYALGVWKGIKIGQEVSNKKEKIDRIEKFIEEEQECRKRFCKRKSQNSNGLCHSCDDARYGF